MANASLVSLLLGLLAAGGAAGNVPAEKAETAVSRLLLYKAQEKGLARARRDLQRGQTTRAAAGLRTILAALPGHYEANVLLAGVEAGGGGFAAAVEHMERAEAELDRLAALCRAWQEQHARDETMERELVSGEAQATMIQSSCRLAGSKVDTGALDRAAGVEGGAAPAPLDLRRFEVPAAYHFLHGNYLFRLRRWLEAAARYRLAVGRDPHLAGAWNNLLGALLNAGQGAEARLCLDQAVQAGVELNPDLRRAVEAAR